MYFLAAYLFQWAISFTRTQKKNNASTNVSSQIVPRQTALYCGTVWFDGLKCAVFWGGSNIYNGTHRCLGWVLRLYWGAHLSHTMC